MKYQRAVVERFDVSASIFFFDIKTVATRCFSLLSFADGQVYKRQYYEGDTEGGVMCHRGLAERGELPPFFFFFFFLGGEGGLGVSAWWVGWERWIGEGGGGRGDRES